MSHATNMKDVQVVDVVSAPAIVSTGAQDMKDCVVVSGRDVVVVTTATHDDGDNCANREPKQNGIQLSPRLLFTGIVALMTCLFVVTTSLIILSFPLISYRQTNIRRQQQQLLDHSNNNMSAIYASTKTTTTAFQLHNRNVMDKKFVELRNEPPVHAPSAFVFDANFQTSRPLPQKVVMDGTQFNYNAKSSRSMEDSECDSRHHDDDDYGQDNTFSLNRDAVFVKANSVQNVVHVHGR